MKRKLILLSLLCLLLAALAVTASAETVASGTCGDNLTWTLDDAGTLTISGEGDVKVEYEKAPWYSQSESIKTIIVDDGITGLSEGVFSGCGNLETITLPFVGAYKTILSYHYKYPFGFVFGTSYYAGSSGTIQYSYSSSVSSSRYSDIYYIPESLKTVIITGSEDVYDAFYNCKNLSSIQLPDSVTHIATHAFYNCSGLTEIVIPNSVTSISHEAFSGSGLVNVIIPNSVTSIGYGLFDRCVNIESITLPFLPGVNGIKNDAYQRPLGYLFGNTGDGVEVEIKQYDYDGGYAQTNYYYMPSSLRSVTIISGEIPYGAFYNCKWLRSITVGSDVTSIGNYAFRYCDGLTDVTFVGDAPVVEGSPFYGVTATAYYPADNDTWTEEVRQSYGGNITWIGVLDRGGSFGKNLIWVVDDDGTLTISGTGEIPSVYGPAPWAAYTEDIQRLVIGDGVTAIGFTAFSGLSNMTSVQFGTGITSVNMNAFADCTALTRVEITDLEAWCKISFGGQTAASNPLYYAKNLHLNGELVTHLVIPGSVSNISQYAFYNCTSLTKVTIPEGVTSIGMNSFSECSNLKELVISNSVTNIGAMAFSGCNLSTVTIGDGYEENVLSAGFSGCKPKKLIIAEGAKEVKNGMVICKNSIEEVVVGDSVTSVAASAFSGCKKLTKIRFRGNAPIIGENAFSGITATVYYPAGDNSWKMPNVKQQYGGNITWKADTEPVLDGLVEVGGVWGYYKDDMLQTDYTGLVLHGGAYFYVQNGILDWSFFGLVEADGYWRYIENGMITWTYTGLAYMNGEYYFVQNSTINWDYTGLVEHNGTYYYIQKGILDWSYYGLAYLDGYWRYIEGGMITWNYTGLAFKDGEWYYVKDSTLSWDYTGLVEFNGTYYYVQNSHLDWSYWGLVYADGYWRYVENGMITWNYTGLAQMNGEYFYVVDSTLDWSYIGLIEHGGGLYYIQSGHLDWSYIGLGYHQDRWLYIYGGMYKEGYDGLVYFNNAWFYVEDSELTWSHFGLYKVDGMLYYLNYSQIDWAYNGPAEYEGVTYDVKNGVVTL